MHIITYISEANVTPDLFKLEINKIQKSSQKRNEKLGVSGVLFLRGNTFVQIIEGPVSAVKSVFQSIQADDRHGDIYVLIDEPINERRFTDWSMECFHEPSCEKEYLDILHEIGEHFYVESTFCPSAVYTYCWRLVAALASNRLKCAA